MSGIKINSDPIKTVLVITVGFLVLYVITRWPWTLATSIIVGIMGVLSEFLAKKIDFVWMKLTRILSFIVPNILLSLVFYLFLTPIAIVSRLFGEKNQLGLKNSSSTMFKNSNKKFEPESFEKTW